MKIYSINTRMPFHDGLKEVSNENDGKVRRFRLGHILFTLQLHSWEIEEFDKKPLDDQEEAIKKALPRKVRQSLEKPNHSYDSDTVKQMCVTAKMIKATTAEIIQHEIDAAEETAEEPTAPVAQPAPQPQVDLQTAAAIMSDFKKMIEELMANADNADQNQPAKEPQNPQQPAEGQKTSDTDAAAVEEAAKAKAAEEAAKAKAAEEKKLRDAVTSAGAEVDKLKAKLNDEKLSGAARDSVSEKYRKALEAYITAGDKLASFINATI